MQTDVSLLKEPVYVHKAQALVYGYIYASQKKLSKIGIQMTYVTPEPETINKFLEEYTFERIEEWFNKLITGFKRWTDYTFDERHKRTESIRELKFPYEYREGQKNLCVSVYRAIEDNTNLYIQAPTGVGKTELSKALAEALFGKEEAMIRVDMSEYMEKHSVSKMIGSPPGYVGHEEGGQLSDQVRTHPYSVLLFDEIEKAHPDVFNVLLQVLDDGHITDSQGRKVDFSNTVIIMTSNAGAKAIIDPKKLGFAAKEDKAGDYKKMKQGVMEEVKQIFRPEFLNRIDEMIVFHTLDKENMKKIVSLLCNEFTGRLEKQMNIHLKLRNSAKELIVEKGTDTKYGARPLRRALQTELEDKLADAILNGDIRPGDHVEAGASKKEIRFFIKSS